MNFKYFLPRLLFLTNWFPFLVSSTSSWSFKYIPSQHYACLLSVFLSPPCFFLSHYQGEPTCRRFHHATGGENKHVSAKRSKNTDDNDLELRTTLKFLHFAYQPYRRMEEFERELKSIFHTSTLRFFFFFVICNGRMKKKKNKLHFEGFELRKWRSINTANDFVRRCTNSSI